MAHLTINFKSTALRMPVVLDVLLPKQCKNCKTLYLLHGQGGDRESWLLRSRVAEYVENKPIAVVMPSGNNLFFADGERSKDYEAFISEELPAQMKLWFGISDKREDRFVEVSAKESSDWSYLDDCIQKTIQHMLSEGSKPCQL